MRMVKLFGWESKMSESIDRKRQEELKVIRKFRILSLISNNIRCVGSTHVEFVLR